MITNAPDLTDDLLTLITGLVVRGFSVLTSAKCRYTKKGLNNMSWNERTFQNGNRVGSNPNVNTKMKPVKCLVVNGQIQPGYEEIVAAVLQQSGMELMPESRRGKAYFAPPVAATAVPKQPKIVRAKIADEPIIIPGDDTQPESYISIDALLEAESILADEYEESARQFDRPDREVIGRKAA